MGDVKRLGYVVFEASDLDAWQRFGEDVLGFEAERRAEGALAFRLDDYAQRVLVTQGSADDLAATGWEVEDEAALKRVEDRLRAAGLPVSRGDEQDVRDRSVAGLIRCTDPNGIPTEIYYGLERAEGPFETPRAISGFLTGEQGMGHLTMAVDSLEDSLHFYRDVLGLNLTDWVQPQIERAVVSTLNIAFLHCNPRHHSLAFWEAKMPKRLHHLMVQCRSVDDVCSTYDLIQEKGVPLEMTLGRHTNDEMLSFYVQTPSGFSIEYGWGAREVGDDWQVQTHYTGSSWGHRRVAAH